MLYDMNYCDNMNLIYPKTINKTDKAIWEYLRLEFRWFRLDK